MTQSAAVVDDVFRALADPTRRKVLECLAKGPASVTQLAEPFDMKLPSFVQHLAVLEQSRLVKSKKKGRVRIFQINPQRVKVAEDWLAEQRRLWETRLDRLDEYLQRLKDKEENP
jgi:DNA-binding transcriptional ArsR family regulator